MIPQNWIEKGLEYLRKTPEANSCVAYDGYTEMIMLRYNNEVEIIEGSNDFDAESEQHLKWIKEMKVEIGKTKAKFLYKSNESEGCYFNFTSPEEGYHIQCFKIVDKKVVNL